MATQYAKSKTPGADLDALATLLEAEANISDAVVVGSIESDGLTNDGSANRMDGTVAILITGTADTDITAAIAAVGSLVKVTNALASSDAET